MSRPACETRIAPDPRDKPLVESLLAEGKKTPDRSGIDAVALRADNPNRLGGELIRQPVGGATWVEEKFEAVSGEWIQQKDGSANINIIYFHGGAYVRGSLKQGRGIASTLAAKTKGRTFAVDYRQAPEDPFPAAVDDAVAAYRQLVSRGISPESIVLAGDSCGGGMVVSAMLKLRDLGESLPAGGVPISPWVDLTFAGPSWHENLETDYVGPLFVKSLAEAYLAGADPRHPLASPIFGDLRGLPPLFIISGGAETLHSDAVVLAEVAERAGVRVQLQTYLTMGHVFPMFNLHTADVALSNAADFIVDVVGAAKKS